MNGKTKAIFGLTFTAYTILTVFLGKKWGKSAAKKELAAAPAITTTDTAPQASVNQ